MTDQFIHLHLHTDYSFLEGACPIYRPGMCDPEDRRRRGDLVTLALEHHSPAVAITDFHAMGGAVEFYEELHAVNVKPIIGCEIAVAPPDCGNVVSDAPSVSGYHLVLLAQDAKGYENLCRIVSSADQSGVSGEPCVRREFLSEHSGGLIAMSACLRGELAASILTGGREAAERTLREYLDVFGKENFFLEVMYHGLEEEKIVNRCLKELSGKFGIPMVATNDVRYLRKEHALAAELLACLRTRTTLDNPNRSPLPPEFYYKSPEEMYAVFGREIPEALPNTLMVAERCDFRFDFRRKHFPVYPVPEGKRQTEVLREFCLRGVPERFGFDLASPPPERKEEAEAIRSRLEQELKVIDRFGESGCFLFVRDFVCGEKRRGIPVGPGCGAGPGSLVAYLTGITGVDPFRFRLLFECFLNPERPQYTIFALEVPEPCYATLFDEVFRKYGTGCAARTASRVVRKFPAAFRDTARVLGSSPSECSRVEKCFSDCSPGAFFSSVRENPKFRKLLEKSDQTRELIQAALLIEGLHSSFGVDADGIVVGDQNLDCLVPLSKGPNGEMVTQYAEYFCEQLGLLKMNLFRQPVLSVISETVEQIRKNRGMKLDPERIPLDDPGTFELLRRGDTFGVFQLEAEKMQALCRQLGVESMEHILALLAMSHPGPMEYIPSFIARKNGEEKIEYDHPKLEPVLRETYGLMLYQEQIMESFHVLAGFSLGRADLVRRAIGKRKISEMEKYREDFIRGCVESGGISPEAAETFWEKICRFSIRAFNKAHSAAYGLLAYRTAYLKANYPQEFLAALSAGEERRSDNLSLLLEECRKQRIPLLLPDVNAGNFLFSAEGRAIRFGLCSIRGLKRNLCRAISESRQKGGPFVSLVDFLERTGGSVNGKALETLIRVGAFDSLGVFRSRLLAVMEESIACASDRRRSQASGQGSLFEIAGDGCLLSDPVLPDIPELEECELRADEKQFLGVDLSEYSGGMGENPVSAAFGTPLPERLEADLGQQEENTNPCSSVRGTMWGERLELRISENQGCARIFEEIRTILRNHSGEVPVLFCVKTAKGAVARIEVAPEFYVTPSLELADDLEALLGKGCFGCSGTATSASRSDFSLPMANKEGVEVP